MVYFGVEDETKAHRLYDSEHEKICVSRYIIFEKEKKWGWCSVGDNKQTVIELIAPEEVGEATDRNCTDTTSTSPHLSSLVTPKGVINSLEQESNPQQRMHQRCFVLLLKFM